MTVFDKSSFGTRLKRHKPTTARYKSEWAEGFIDGYEAALARYIELKNRK